jgi:exonuclease III
VAATWNAQGNGLATNKKAIAAILDAGLVDLFCFQEVSQSYQASTAQLQVYAVEHQDAQIIHSTTGATAGRGYCVMYRKSVFDKFSAQYMPSFLISTGSDAVKPVNVHAPMIYKLRLRQNHTIRMLNYHAPNEGLKLSNSKSLYAADAALKVVKLQEITEITAAAARDSKKAWFLIGDLNVTRSTLRQIFRIQRHWAISEVKKGKRDMLDHLVGLYRADDEEQPVIRAASGALADKLKALQSDHDARGFSVLL